MPGARSNTKYRCKDCGSIFDFTDRIPTPCANCGAFEWEQIVVAHVCDFCSSNDSRWEYQCEDFAAPTIPGLPLTQISRGSWAACDVCHDIIEANDRDGLVQRSIATSYSPLARAGLPGLRKLVRDMHESFYANRIGEVIDHGE